MVGYTDIVKLWMESRIALEVSFWPHIPEQQLCQRQYLSNTANLICGDVCINDMFCRFDLMLLPFLIKAISRPKTSDPFKES